MSVSPLLTHRTPNSVLDAKDKPPAFYIGQGARRATCSGVAWLGDSRLATLNLLGNVVHVHDFSPADRSLSPVEQPNLSGLAHPEHAAVSVDYRWLAVTNSGDGSVGLYRLSQGGLRIEPEPVVQIREPGDRISHGVSFSPCGSSLVTSTIDEPGVLRCYMLRPVGEDGLAVEPVGVLANREVPQKPKGLAHTPDGRFLAVGYGPNATSQAIRPDGQLSIHTVGPDGIDPRPLAKSPSEWGLGCVEDVSFSPDGTRIFLSDQAADAVVVVGFDPETGRLGPELMRLGTGLDFPHGNAVSPDGRVLAVANYGSDALVLYEI